MVHSSRARRREGVLQEILGTARRIVTDEGLDALTLQRLAGELGYATTALYRYFPSKDALHAELIGASIEALAASIAAARDPSLGPLDQVRTATEAYIRFAREAPEELRLIALATGDPKILVPSVGDATKVMAKAAPIVVEIGALLDEAAEAGELAPGPGVLRALQLWSALHGALLLKKLVRLAPSEVDVEALARAQVETLLAGFQAGTKPKRSKGKKENPR